MTATIRQCAILAGGLATRLGAISAETPKPVLDIGGRPFLYWLMRELQRFGVDEFVILTGHLAGSVEHAVRAAAFALPRPATLRFSVEPAPAGTGGALHYARGMLDPRFLLCNGDSLLDANLAELLRDAAADGAARVGRMLIRRLDDASRYGMVAAENGRVTSFAERPPPGTPGTINAGISVLDRAVLDRVAPQCSLERDVLPNLAAEGRLGATTTDGWFIDIGIPADLQRARHELPARLSRPALFLGGRRQHLARDRDALAAIRRATAAGWHVFAVTDRTDLPEHVRAAADTARRNGGTIDDACDADTLNDLIGRWQLDPAHCVMVNATASDLDAAKAIGIERRHLAGGDLDAFIAPLLARASMATAFAGARSGD